jgi:hypothetical protein
VSTEPRSGTAALRRFTLVALLAAMLAVVPKANRAGRRSAANLLALPLFAVKEFTRSVFGRFGFGLPFATWRDLPQESAVLLAAVLAIGLAVYL